MKGLPFDMVADWQPKRESLLPSARELAAFVAAVAFCGLIGAVAILFA